MISAASRANKPCATFTSTKAVRPSSRRSFIITPGVKKMDNLPINPMQPTRLAQAPRCLARTRSGAECQSPAVKGGARCRMHGGKGSGAPKGNRNAWKHGARSLAILSIASALKSTSSN